MLRQFCAVLLGLLCLIILSFPMGYMGPTGTYVLIVFGIGLGYLYKELWNFTLGRWLGKIEKKGKKSSG